MKGHWCDVQSMGDASEIVFDVVVVTSMELLVRLHKKDFQPSRAAFVSFCFLVELVGGTCREQPCVHLTATKINQDNVLSMGDAFETFFEVVGGDVA